MALTVGRVTTASAQPGALLAYASEVRTAGHRLRVVATAAASVVDRCYAASVDYHGPRRNPAADASDLAVRSDEADAWVGRVGVRFLLADGGALFCALTGGVVTIDDDDLVAAGWPSRADAAAAGRDLATEVGARLDDLLDDDDDDDDIAEEFSRWVEALRPHQADAAFTAAFFGSLGAERTHQLAYILEHRWPRAHMRDPEWGLVLLAPFSEALATAMDTRRVLAARGEVREPTNLHMPDRYRLDESFVDGLLDLPSPYAYNEPEERHVALLFAAGVFPRDVLLRLAADVVTPRLAYGTDGSPFGITPWAYHADPVAIVFGALARNPDASLDYVEGDGGWPDADALRLMLERWSELDGDAGRSAALVLQNALTHDDRGRAAALFDRAVHTLTSVGEVRNPFAYEALAHAVDNHIERVGTVAATEGRRESLVELHTFLRLLLADDNAAATIFDSTVAHAAHTFEGAGVDDPLGSEVWEVGAVFGLVLSADAAADIDEAEQRIARRQALLDGVRQITDLGLTVTRGRWIPFVRAGRDAMLDRFRTTDDLDEALSDIATVRDEYRLRMSELIAARLVHDGALDPKPAAMSIDAWMASEEVRDAITALRTQVGQSFDEVVDVLEAEQ